MSDIAIGAFIWGVITGIILTLIFNSTYVGRLLSEIDKLKKELWIMEVERLKMTNPK